MILIILFISSIIDIKTRYVYSPLNILVLLLGLIKHLTSSFNLIDILLGLTVIPSTLILLNIIKKESIGDGDIEYLSALGFYYGYQIQVLAFFLSVLLIFFYSLFNKKKRYPMIPFISLSYLIVLYIFRYI